MCQELLDIRPAFTVHDFHTGQCQTVSSPATLLTVNILYDKFLLKPNQVMGVLGTMHDLAPHYRRSHSLHNSTNKCAHL